MTQPDGHTKCQPIGFVTSEDLMHMWLHSHGSPLWVRKYEGVRWAWMDCHRTRAYLTYLQSLALLVQSLPKRGERKIHLEFFVMFVIPISFPNIIIHFHILCNSLQLELYWSSHRVHLQTAITNSAISQLLDPTLWQGFLFLLAKVSWVIASPSILLGQYSM